MQSPNLTAGMPPPVASAPEATHVLVPYQSPLARASATAGQAAVGLMFALLAVWIPILADYLKSGNFSKAQLTALLSSLAIAALGVLGTFVAKWINAHANDAPPTFSTMAVRRGERL